MTQKPASHYDRMTNATESQSDPKPFTDEAIRARRRALDEGRLTIVDNNEPSTLEPVECGFCDAAPPRYSNPGQLFPNVGVDLQWDPNTFSWIKTMPTTADSPGVNFATVAGDFGNLTVVRAEVVQASGSCAVDEAGNCETSAPCEFIVSIKFGLFLSNDPDIGISPAIPNLLITNPLTGVPNAAITPIAGTAVSTGNTSTCDYLFTDTKSLDCGTSFDVTLDMATLAPNPSVGAWLSKTYSNPTQKLILECQDCMEGGKDA